MLFHTDAIEKSQASQIIHKIELVLQTATRSNSTKLRIPQPITTLIAAAVRHVSVT